MKRFSKVKKKLILSRNCFRDGIDLRWKESRALGMSPPIRKDLLYLVLQIVVDGGDHTHRLDVGSVLIAIADNELTL